MCTSRVIRRAYRFGGGHVQGTCPRGCRGRPIVLHGRDCAGQRERRERPRVIRAPSRLGPWCEYRDPISQISMPPTGDSGNAASRVMWSSDAEPGSPRADRALTDPTILTRFRDKMSRPRRTVASGGGVSYCDRSGDGLDEAADKHHRIGRETWSNPSTGADSRVPPAASDGPELGRLAMRVANRPLETHTVADTDPVRPHHREVARHGEDDLPEGDPCRGARREQRGES
jgi:hypothetical protein